MAGHIAQNIVNLNARQLSDFRSAFPSSGRRCNRDIHRRGVDLGARLCNGQPKLRGSHNDADGDISG